MRESSQDTYQLIADGHFRRPSGLSAESQVRDFISVLPVFKISQPSLGVKEYINSVVIVNTGTKNYLFSPRQESNIK